MILNPEMPVQVRPGLQSLITYTGPVVQLVRTLKSLFACCSAFLFYNKTENGCRSRGLLRTIILIGMPRRLLRHSFSTGKVAQR